MGYFYSAFCPLVAQQKWCIFISVFLFCVIFFRCAGWELGKSWLKGPHATVTFKVLDKWAMYHVSEWIEGRDKRALLYESAFLRTQRPVTPWLLHCTWDFNIWGKQQDTYGTFQYFKWSNSKVPKVLFWCHTLLLQENSFNNDEKYSC